jgi:hypothetical protein
VHAGREPKGICIQHRVVGVEEVVHVVVVEWLIAIVRCQRGWARKWGVLRRRHGWWHAVRRRKVVVREGAGAGAGRLIAGFLVVVIVGLFIILLLYTPISLGLQSPIPKCGIGKIGVSLPSWFMWSEY